MNKIAWHFTSFVDAKGITQYILHGSIKVLGKEIEYSKEIYLFHTQSFRTKENVGSLNVDMEYIENTLLHKKQVASRKFLSSNIKFDPFIRKDSI